MEDKKGVNKRYIKFGIVIFAWLLVIFGLSYAYFSILFNDDEKNTTDVITGLLDVDFVTDEYINNDSMWPINDEEIFSNGDISAFSITRAQNNTVENVYYNIYLQDIEITDNYKSAYLKWRLYDKSNPTAQDTPVSEGTFENIGDRTSIQLNRDRISLPKNITHNYTLYIWISNSTTHNQLDLLNGEIEAKVEVIAVSD